MIMMIFCGLESAKRGWESCYQYGGAVVADWRSRPRELWIRCKRRLMDVTYLFVLQRGFCSPLNLRNEESCELPRKGGVGGAAENE